MVENETIYINKNFRIRFQSKHGFIGEKRIETTREAPEFWALLGVYDSKKVMLERLTRELIISTNKTYDEIERVCNELEEAMKKVK